METFSRHYFCSILSKHSTHFAPRFFIIKIIFVSGVKWWTHVLPWWKIDGQLRFILMNHRYILIETYSWPCCCCCSILRKHSIHRKCKPSIKAPSLCAFCSIVWKIVTQLSHHQMFHQFFRNVYNSSKVLTTFGPGNANYRDSAYFLSTLTIGNKTRVSALTLKHVFSSKVIT